MAESKNKSTLMARIVQVLLLILWCEIAVGPLRLIKSCTVHPVCWPCLILRRIFFDLGFFLLYVYIYILGSFADLPQSDQHVSMRNSSAVKIGQIGMRRNSRGISAQLQSMQEVQ